MTKKEDRNLKLNIWLIFPFMHLCVKKNPSTNKEYMILIWTELLCLYTQLIEKPPQI